MRNSILFTVLFLLISPALVQKYEKYTSTPGYEIRVEPYLTVDIKGAHDSCAKEGAELLEMNKPPDLFVVNAAIGRTKFTGSQLCK